MFAAASKASEIARMMPIIVPNSAISTVCNVGQAADDSLEKSGGKARHMMSAMPWIPVIKSCGRASTTISA